MDLIEGASVLHAGTSPALVIIGGEHGNEPAGIRAIERIRTLVEDGDWRLGCALYGLIGNPRAVEKGTRFIDENLNRAFGRSKAGTVEDGRARDIAAWLTDLKTQHGDLYVLDLHSVSVGDMRMIILRDDEERRALAAAVSPITLRILAREEVIPGTLLGFVESIGGVALVVECGNHSSAHGETVALEHAERLLKYMGAVEARTSFIGLERYDGTPRTYALKEAIAPSEGFAWTLPIASELLIPAGTVFARDTSGERTTHEDRYLMMPSRIPEPDDFDAGFLASLV